MKPNISIIVPIYNVEKYLPKCIESLINQTLKNIEIILVNDGSTDSSGDIADSYQKIDDRIKVLHKKNGGQGEARNLGLDIAKGEYIGFVDSDDWIDSNMYEKLYEKAVSKNLDVVSCGRKIFDEIYKLGTVIDVKGEFIENIQKDIPEYIIKYLLYPNTVSACNKIYKAEVIEKNKIRFKDVSEVGSEDAMFNIYILMNINIVASISEVYYNGVERDGSTTRVYKEGCMRRTAALIEEIYRYTKKIDRKNIGDIIAPILLIFFQQWNYNYIKSYSGENIERVLADEFREAEKSKYFKKAELSFIFSRKANVYITSMGYSNKGKLFIKLCMLLNLIGLNKLAAKLRIII